jgi:dUTP pyrophosphatase
MKVKVKRIAPDAKLPAYAHEGDAGMDLFANESLELKPGERALIGTGIKIELPPNTEAQVRPRSGLAIKHGITVLNTPGTIDSGYRGEVKVILINLGQETVKIEKGQKIAQIVFKHVEHVELEEVDKLSETTRGEGGFGSTGLR